MKAKRREWDIKFDISNIPHLETDKIPKDTKRRIIFRPRNAAVPFKRLLSIFSVFEIKKILVILH